MKKIIKFKNIALIGTIVFSASLAPFNNANAVENQSNQNNYSYDTSNSINEQKKMLKDNGWQEQKNSDGSVTYTMDDYTMISKMKAKANPSQVKTIDKATHSLMQQRSYGVNSFKIDQNGNFTLKLNKTIAQTLAAGGIGGATAAISLIPGVGWSIAGGIAGSMAGVLTGAAIHSGIIVKGKLPNKIYSWAWQ